MRFTVAYHGEPFAGLARNEGVDTVAGRLEDAFSLITGGTVRLVGAGRTDRGVHAIGQVISVDLPVEFPLDLLCRRVNKLCAPYISVREPAIVDDRFDARHSARFRAYRYLVWNSDIPSPLLGDRSWHVPYHLDVAAMAAGAIEMVGDHDFSSMCRRPPDIGPEVPLRRTVLSAAWSGTAGDLLEFDIRGLAFCHQMVRSIVGLCVDIGRGRRSAADVAGILAARNRAAAPPVAPAHGLCLMEVGYESQNPEVEPTTGRRSTPVEWSDHLPGRGAAR